MIQNGSENYSKSKPVGIVITSGFDKEQDMPWHPALSQIDTNITAIEKSIFECALAGCSSIWVCCDETLQPLVKNRVGDYTRDPVQVSKASFTNYPSENHVDIPIYFYLVNPKDRKKRSGACWDVFSTALTIFFISKKVSRWTIPHKYYVSFCNGLYDNSALQKYRDLLRKDTDVCFACEGNTFMDGLRTGFTISGDAIRDIIVNLKQNRKYHNSSELAFADLEGLIDIKKYKNIEIDQYFTCNNWNSRVEYIKNRQFNYKFDRDYFFNINSFGVTDE
jgi:hypothetical protein